MARARTKTEEANTEASGNDVFDQAIAARQQQETAQAQQRQPGDEPTEEPKKKWTPPENPYGFENIKGATNRVRLLKSESEKDRRDGTGAWVIRFAHNPNDDKGPNGETYSKENPHPVLKMLKGEGYRWGFDEDGKGGWGKGFQGDGYGADHIEARRVLRQAAEMIGAPKEQEIPTR